MLHTIENEHLICTIESQGAEIRSLINKQTGQEYIWQIDTSVWGSSSPILFPSIGVVKENKIIYNDTQYAMPKHGIVRNNDSMTFAQNSKSQCLFKLQSSENTLKQYPFKFSFTVDFKLVSNQLVTTYHIVNYDTNAMKFICGGHTAYKCSLDKGVTLSDYVIEFPKKITLESLTLGASGLLTSKKRKLVTNENYISLSNTLFNADALIFPDIEFDWVRLRKKNESKGIIVRFSGYPHLALWSKPFADYVCIEPWLGLPDKENESVNLNNKSTYKTLAPGDSYSIAIETEIE